MYMIRGEVPHGYCAMASADPAYIAAHGKAWMVSATLAGMNVHLNMVGGSYDDWIRMNQLRSFVWQKHASTITLSQTIGIQAANVEETRTFYACSRFLLAAEFVDDAFPWTRHRPSLLLTDIDCVFEKYVDEPSCLGLFLRESLPGTSGWEADGTKIAAGLVYVPGVDRVFLHSVAHYIRSQERRWFLDQVALSTVGLKLGLIPNHVHRFTQQDMDWEFLPGTKIWTGKGDRKHTNAIYLARKKHYEDILG